MTQAKCEVDSAGSVDFEAGSTKLRVRLEKLSGELDYPGFGHCDRFGELWLLSGQNWHGFNHVGGISTNIWRAGTLEQSWGDFSRIQVGPITIIRFAASARAPANAKEAPDKRVTCGGPRLSQGDRLRAMGRNNKHGTADGHVPP